jgi:hypothetical protein
MLRSKVRNKTMDKANYVFCQHTTLNLARHRNIYLSEHFVRRGTHLTARLPRTCPWHCASLVVLRKRNETGGLKSRKITAAQYPSSNLIETIAVYPQHPDKLFRKSHSSFFSICSCHFVRRHASLEHCACASWRLFPASPCTPTFETQSSYTGKSLCALSFAPALSPATCKPRAK